MCKKPKPVLRLSDTKPVILFNLMVTLPCIIVGMVALGLGERLTKIVLRRV